MRSGRAEGHIFPAQTFKANPTLTLIVQGVSMCGLQIAAQQHGRSQSLVILSPARTVAQPFLTVPAVGGLYPPRREQHANPAPRPPVSEQPADSAGHPGAASGQGGRYGCSGGCSRCFEASGERGRKGG